MRYGKDGEAGYLRWLAANHPGYFSSLYGKLIPFDVNQKTETKTVVRYETVEERRQAMIAKGWSPAVLAALEEAMEPKFRSVLMSFVMRLGWPGFRPSLLPFWNLFWGLGLAMAFPFSFRTLRKQSATYAAPACFVFAFSDMHHITTQSHGLVAKFWANVCLDAFHLDVLLGDPPSLHRHPRVQIQRLRGPYVGSPPITLADAIRQGAGDGGDFAKNSHNDPELQQHFTFPTARSTTR